MKKILVSGLIAYDKILDYPGKFSDHILHDKIHTLNVSFVAQTMTEHFGGCAGNIAYNLAMLGEHPIVLGAAGKDFDPYRLHMEKIGADLKYVRTVRDKPTSQVTIMTDSGDNQIAGVYLGTMAYSCELAESDISGDEIAIVAPGNLDDMCRLPELYRKRNVPFIFDPGQQIPQMSTDQLRGCIPGALALISNDYELSLICEKLKIQESQLLDQTQYVITTLGEKGSQIKNKKETIAITAAKASTVLDPTGAGDAYRAGLIKGMIAGWSLEVSCRFAGVISAYAIEAYGCQSHIISFEQAKERYRQNFGDTLS